MLWIDKLIDFLTPQINLLVSTRDQNSTVDEVVETLTRDRNNSQSKKTTQQKSLLARSRFLQNCPNANASNKPNSNCNHKPKGKQWRVIVRKLRFRSEARWRRRTRRGVAEGRVEPYLWSALIVLRLFADEVEEPRRRELVRIVGNEYTGFLRHRHRHCIL